MRTVWTTAVGAAAAASLLTALALGPGAARGDEPGRLGRLFRFGGSPSAPAPAPAPKEVVVDEVKPLAPPPAPTGEVISSLPGAGPAVVPTPAGPAPRIMPQPRTTRSATDADPIVTRVTLGRSDEGGQFAMFLQVYADGTVIDSEGVHNLGRGAIKGVLDALTESDIYRVRGHCGGPPTDFVEQVQMVVYERSLGRLRANSFSFSGNTQGCDHAVKHLQSALDALVLKISRPAAPAGAVAAPAPAVSSPVAPPVEAPAAGPPTLRLNEEPAAPAAGGR